MFCFHKQINVFPKSFLYAVVSVLGKQISEAFQESNDLYRKGGVWG